MEKIYKYDYSFELEEEAFKIKYELEKYARIAHMGEIIESTKQKPIIGTTALDTCYGVVLYDRTNKRAIVGHLPPSNRSMLIEMLHRLDKDKKQEIEYAIVSGYRNIERKDYSGIEELLSILRTYCPPNVILKPFYDIDFQVCSNVLAYEFAFEVNTGQNVGQYLFYDGEQKNKKYK